MVLSRYYMVIFLILFLFTFNSTALAGEYQWEIVVDQYGEITERVSLQDVNMTLNTEGWKQLDDNGENVLERSHKDWAEYDKTGNGLPLSVKSKNYVVFTLLTLTYDSNKKSEAELFNQLTSSVNGSIKYQSTGIIQESSANHVNNLSKDPQAVWNVKAGQATFFQESPFFLKVTFVNGVMISIIILFFGFLGITIWYLIYVRRVNKIIEEEYSIDNIERLLEEEISEENK
jgi:hypothetical protein